ncbi:hypothetical protein DB30_07673 [Enhygromyxa salina]|uniref:Uncharacterized protein n=1 Tax=Enhygromyxa salina TaxID=215803 RepID=A0A0C2A5E0_9BACT|nr:hypothetical protein DB30_07673 [Enhygromyxa salina]
MLAWFGFARPGAAVVSIRYLEMLRGAPGDELFTPGALIEFELEPVPAPKHSSEGVGAGAAAAAGPGSATESRAPDDARAKPGLPSEELELREVDPNAGLLRARHAARGLGGRGETAGVDPRRLQGSQALYDGAPSGRASEGPKRPRPKHKPDYKFERVGDKWIYRHPDGSFMATVQEDGGVQFRNKLIKIRAGSMPGVRRDGEEFVTLTVEHDTVGIVRLARGREPNERVKAELLAATLEMRMEIAEQYQKQRLIEELGELERELDEIWNASARSVAARKELLFLRWDECDEAASSGDGEASGIDDSRQGMARAARRKITRFIARVAPQDGPDAFTEQELADMNRRRVSTQVFAPYG